MNQLPYQNGTKKIPSTRVAWTNWGYLECKFWKPVLSLSDQTFELSQEQFPKNACKTIRCLCRKSTVKAFIRCRIIAFGSGTNVQLNHFIKNKIEFIRVLSQSNMSRFRSKSDTDANLDANWNANFNWRSNSIQIVVQIGIHIGYISDLNA